LNCLKADGGDRQKLTHTGLSSFNTRFPKPDIREAALTTQADHQENFNEGSILGLCGRWRFAEMAIGSDN
jgi:hypothetical protein